MLPLLLLVALACVFSIASGRSNTDDPVSHHVLLDMAGFGTAGLGDQTHQATLEALKLGVRMIDSAQAPEWYDEKGVGSAVAEFLSTHQDTKEQEIVIITKVHPRDFDYNEMDHMLEQSKLNFRRNYIDVVLLHAPGCWPGHCTPEEEAINWEKGWENLVALKSKHDIRAIGVSNFDVPLLRRLVIEKGAEVDVLQNWMDPFHQDYEARDFCLHHGIQYMAYSSFGNQWKRHPNPVLTNAVLRELAEAHGVSVPQVIMSWLHTEGVIAIPRTTNVAHMKDNFAQLIGQRALQAQCASIDAEGGELPLTCDAGYAHADWHLSYQELEAIRFLDGTMGTPWD
jgi:diketogulonate reductase-like aldo/keto reductase